MGHPHPTGWSKWTHKQKGGEYTFLTVAKGTGPDHGVEFAYYLGLDKGSGMLHAFVRRLDDWHEAMEPHPTAENAYEKRLRELEAEAGGGPWYLYHPESDCAWIEETRQGRDEALGDGLVHEIDAEEYRELTADGDDELDELI